MTATERIKELRLARGLSLRGLARHLGVTPPAIMIMERPGNYPSAEKLPAIAEALGCSIDDLFGRSTKS